MPDDLADAASPVLEGLPSVVRDDVLDRVAELPLVGRGSIGCWPHPVWSRPLVPSSTQRERRRVMDSRIGALLDRGAVSEAGGWRWRCRPRRPRCRRAVRPRRLPGQRLKSQIRGPGSGPTFSPPTFQKAGGSTPSLRSNEDDEAKPYRRLEEVRHAFEARGDLDGETGVLLQLQAAWRGLKGDLGALVTFLARGQVLAEPVAMSRAQSPRCARSRHPAQLAGRPARRGTGGGFGGGRFAPADWAAQGADDPGDQPPSRPGGSRPRSPCLEGATGEGSEGRWPPPTICYAWPGGGRRSPTGH